MTKMLDSSAVGKTSTQSELREDIILARVPKNNLVLVLSIRARVSYYSHPSMLPEGILRKKTEKKEKVRRKRDYLMERA